MIYFASDFHLGVDAKTTSAEREKLIVRWLEEVRQDATEIFLVGDIFDFWFEYRTVIPKGYSRLIGKLGELRDQGIPITFFTGNHDMWMFDYFREELGIPILRQPIVREFSGKKFMIGHGDGLGPGDHGYKFIKKVFANRLCQIAFSWIHPSIGMSIAHFWSRKSRDTNREASTFLGPEKEWLVQYCERKLKTEYYDYFIFGHRHLPIDFTLSNASSRYINLGEWMNYNSYGKFDGQKMQLEFFHNPDGRTFP